MQLKGNKMAGMPRIIYRVVAVALATTLLTACGATAMIDADAAIPAAAQQAGEAYPSTGAPGLRTNESNAQTEAQSWLTLLLAGLAGAHGSTTQLTPETADEADIFTAEQRAELDDFCDGQQGAFSVYAQDLMTGSVYTYGTQNVYYPASLLKAAYALWLCEQADAGEIDLDEDIPNRFMGRLDDEKLQQYNDSETIPARAAMEEMISVSDNDSTTILAEAWPGTPGSGFADFLRKLGFSDADSCIINVEDGILGNMTVMDAAASMTALYNYFESDAENATFLKECLFEADHDMLYVPDGVQAAKKYGSWAYAYHDAAIVYAPIPYIICCMTDQGTEDEDFPAEPTQTMQQLGKMVYDDLG